MPFIQGYGKAGIPMQQSPSAEKPSRFQKFTNRLFDPGALSDEGIRYNRELADAMLNQAVNRPVGHPTQGLASLMQALNAQIYRQRSAKGKEALQKQRAQEVGDFLAAMQSGDEAALQSAIKGAGNNPVLASMVGPYLSNRFAVEAREDQQEYGTSEREASQGFTAGESRKDREFRAGESQKDRNVRAIELQDERVFRSEMQSAQFRHEKEMAKLENKLAMKLKSDSGFDLTERQGKASAWAMSYASGNKYLTDQLNGTGDFEGRGPYVPNLKDSAVFAASIDEKTGAVNRELLSRTLSDEAIEYFQSAYMLIDPIVRQRTGAAVREFEFITMVRTLIPLSNDTPQSLKQKEISRSAALEGIMLETGPGAQYLSQQYGITMPGQQRSGGGSGGGYGGGPVYDTQGNLISTGGGM